MKPDICYLLKKIKKGCFQLWYDLRSQHTILVPNNECKVSLYKEAHIECDVQLSGRRSDATENDLTEQNMFNSHKRREEKEPT